MTEATCAVCVCRSRGSRNQVIGLIERRAGERLARHMIARFVDCVTPGGPRDAATNSSGLYMANWRVLFIVLAAIGGCTAGSPLTNTRTPSADEWNAALQVILLAPGDATPEGTLSLGEMSTMSCAHLTTDRAATRTGTLHQLQLLAYRAGASALSNVLCETPRIYPLGKNCWSAVSCRGTAVRVPD